MPFGVPASSRAPVVLWRGSVRPRGPRLVRRTPNLCGCGDTGCVATGRADLLLPCPDVGRHMVEVRTAATAMYRHLPVRPEAPQITALGVVVRWRDVLTIIASAADAVRQPRRSHFPGLSAPVKA